MIIKIIAIFVAVLCATTGLNYNEDTANDTQVVVRRDDYVVPIDYISLSNYICNNLVRLT